MTSPASSTQSDDNNSKPRATNAAFSIRIIAAIPNKPGNLGRVTTAIGAAGGNIASLDMIEFTGNWVIRAITVFAASEEHGVEITKALEQVDGVQIRQVVDRTFELHEGGAITMGGKAPLRNRDDLAMAYTPGVARICEAIAADPTAVHRYTIKKNTVAVVSDGTAILGLGNLGPEAAIPVMEGKSLLFKEFAGVDAWPICLKAGTVDEIVKAVQQIAPVFGGINLEDIAAPACFEIEERLRATLDIPVFHDDQHGTAVVVLAALQNSARVVGRSINNMRVVIAGVGAAGVAVAKILLGAGVGDIIGVDRTSAISKSRTDIASNPAKTWMAANTNKNNFEGSLSEALVDADVFIGLSGPDLITRQDVLAMKDQPIVFALANPTPEIMPELIDDIVGVIATGRSDYPNQINNVLCFPGIFRGALDSGATQITESMKLAAANAIAETVETHELDAAYVIPSAFDRRVVERVATAVAAAAKQDGVCRPS
jgi:malate dehydrogenase (oxaloacetate-decarboxylating)